MNWQFIDANILTELESGYSLHLIEGTWFHPRKVIPESPQGISFSKQVKLLKGGFDHVKSIGEERQAS